MSENTLAQETTPTAFVAYEALGQIIQTGSCPKDQLKFQVVPDCTVIEGSARIGLDWVVDGEIRPLPPKPSVHHVVDYKERAWIDPRTVASEWIVVRNERDRRIAETDWTQYQDTSLALKVYWAPYRQALRDITTQPDPFNIVWPEQPEPFDVNTAYPLFTGLSKLNLFTADEQVAIATASNMTPLVKLVYDRFLTADYLSYSDPEVVQGLHLLVQSGLLTQERKEGIVQQMLPPALRG
jgi:hypothetical protein